MSLVDRLGRVQNQFPYIDEDTNEIVGQIEKIFSALKNLQKVLPASEPSTEAKSKIHDVITAVADRLSDIVGLYPAFACHDKEGQLQTAQEAYALLNSILTHAVEKLNIEGFGARPDDVSKALKESGKCLHKLGELSEIDDNDERAEDLFDFFLAAEQCTNANINFLWQAVVEQFVTDDKASDEFLWKLCFRLYAHYNELLNKKDDLDFAQYRRNLELAVDQIAGALKYAGVPRKLLEDLVNVSELDGLGKVAVYVKTWCKDDEKKRQARRAVIVFLEAAELGDNFVKAFKSQTVELSSDDESDIEENGEGAGAGAGAEEPMRLEPVEATLEQRLVRVREVAAAAKAAEYSARRQRHEAEKQQARLEAQYRAQLAASASEVRGGAKKLKAELDGLRLRLAQIAAGLPSQQAHASRLDTAAAAEAAESQARVVKEFTDEQAALVKQVEEVAARHAEAEKRAQEAEAAAKEQQEAAILREAQNVKQAVAALKKRGQAAFFNGNHSAGEDGEPTKKRQKARADEEGEDDVDQYRALDGHDGASTAGIGSDSLGGSPVASPAAPAPGAR